MRGIFTVSFRLAFMLTHYMDSSDSCLVFSMAMLFRCSCFSTFSCNDADTITLLPFMAIPSITTISFLNDQYGCSSFYTSTFVDGQPWST